MMSSNNVEPDFVGRQEDIDKLYKAFRSGKRLIQLTGLHAVGKSRTMKKMISDHLSCDSGIEMWKTCDFRNGELELDICTLVLLISEVFGLVISKNCTIDELTDEVIKMLDSFLTPTKFTNVIFLDNTEAVLKNGGCLREPLLKFCCLLLKKCANVCILMTTTTKVCFAQMKAIVHAQDLCEMDQYTSVELLRTLCPENLKKSPYLEPLAALCSGLPLAILMTGTVQDHL